MFWTARQGTTSDTCTAFPCWLYFTCVNWNYFRLLLISTVPEKLFQQKWQGRKCWNKENVRPPDLDEHSGDPVCPNKLSGECFSFIEFLPSRKWNQGNPRGTVFSWRENRTGATDCIPKSILGSGSKLRGHWQLIYRERQPRASSSTSRFEQAGSTLKQRSQMGKVTFHFILSRAGFPNLCIGNLGPQSVLKSLWKWVAGQPSLITTPHLSMTLSYFENKDLTLDTL